MYRVVIYDVDEQSVCEVTAGIGINIIISCEAACGDVL
jgi:hypothetical protein